jgi:hypothetical protein
MKAFYAAMLAVDLTLIPFRPHVAVLLALAAAWFAFRLGGEVGKL